MRLIEEKYRTVIDRNTFFFFNAEFEEQYEVQNINAITDLLSNLYFKIQQDGIRKEYFEELLLHPYGLKAILTLNGLSKENLKRIITLTRVFEDETLNQLLFKSKWLKPNEIIKDGDIKEWGDSRIITLIKNNEYFRKGLVNLFFEGVSNPLLNKVLRPFEVRKLSIHKLRFDMHVMLSH